MTTYQIITDASTDGFDVLFNDLPEIQVLPMDVSINDTSYLYGVDGNISAKSFYSLQRSGKFAHTSQITPAAFCQYFTPFLEQGNDILYLGLTSGLSGTMQSAELAAEQLKALYPERRIVCLDTYCASVGQGFIVLETLRRQKEGYSLDELITWITDNRMQVCHWFTVDVFEHLKHGGRVSGASAALGTVLNIKPMLHLNAAGQLEVTDKLRGRKRAIEAKVTKMTQGWDSTLGNLVVIGHGDC
ncbi:MAG: DegV family protein, partial [Peptococcaceae bacterium]|nr:DegV family protein [Peptococcaceae bacterium]